METGNPSSIPLTRTCRQRHRRNKAARNTSSRSRSGVSVPKALVNWKHLPAGTQVLYSRLLVTYDLLSPVAWQNEIADLWTSNRRARSEAITKYLTTSRLIRFVYRYIVAV